MRIKPLFGNLPGLLAIFLFTLVSPFIAASSVSASSGEDLFPGVPKLSSSLDAIVKLSDEDIPLVKVLYLAGLPSGRGLTGATADVRAVEEELDRLAGRIRPFLGDRRDLPETVAALNSCVFVKEGFVYDSAAGIPENYLLDRVLARKRGNCLGLSLLYLAIAERLDIPLRGAYVPTHSLLRYADGGKWINIELGDKGGEWADERYERLFGLTRGRPYLRPLGKKEMIGVYLKSLGAGYSRKGSDGEALRLYKAAALFSPDLPDVYYNAGVSYQKMGRTDAAVALYRHALLLDPEMSAARGNLAATLCNCGKLEEGIEEFRKALTINPGNTKARAGLAKAYFARGAYPEAIEHCDRAMEEGYKFEPSLLEALNRHRRPAGIPSP